MDIKTIFTDALKYPGDDWMKVILLGFLSLISIIGTIPGVNLFSMIFLVLLPLPVGYLFKVIKSSFNGFDVLPGFNSLNSMYLDGVKVILTLIIYSLPLIAILLIFDPEVMFYLDLASFSLLYLGSLLLGSWIQICALVLIGFIEYIGVANMALYDGEISAAFRFREIIKRISMIGLRKYLISYIIVLILGVIVVTISSFAMSNLVGIMVIPLLVAPYFLLLNARFLALIFASSEY